MTLVLSSIISSPCCFFCFFFFNDTATTEIYTLSLHDALPICPGDVDGLLRRLEQPIALAAHVHAVDPAAARRLARSEEHTSELQSPDHLVCRLLLEKKKTFSPCTTYRIHSPQPLLTSNNSASK